MKHDVFISYSRTDINVAEDICRAFDEAGISYWIDRDGIASGEAFHEAIVKAIHESKITVFISSVNSNMSEYTIKEIVIAFKSKKHIIPFCIDEEPYADKIEFYLCDLDQVQYYFEKEFAIQKLLDDVSKLLDKRTGTTTPAPRTAPSKSELIVPTGQYILKICPNLTCAVFVDYEPRTEAPVGKITKLSMNKGTFLLEFVSTENEQDKFVIKEYVIADPAEQLLHVDLESIAQKRKEWIAYLEKAELVYYEDASGKYGFKDKATGDIIIQAKYDTVKSFNDGLAAVKLSDKWGYIDKTGKVVIPFKYEEVREFSEGLAAVKLNDKWGFIDKTGKVVIPFKYDNAGCFSEGLAIVSLNGKWGYIDKTGKEVIPFKYGYFLFYEGLAAVKLNDKWGYIDKTGKEVIPFKYDYADSFKNGQAVVNLNGEIFHIDKSGNRV